MKRISSNLIGLAAIFLALTTPAHAEMVLSKVIVDIAGDDPQHDDIEIFNEGEERLYIVAEPAEIRDPGLPTEQRIELAQSADGALLVSPRRIILEPGERRLLRVAALGPVPSQDSVYRIAVKPVVGEVEASASALKVLVGYDVLVIRRPLHVTGEVTATRSEGRLRIANGTNTAREFYAGRQCDPQGQVCVDLPTNRLYPGETWEINLPYSTKVTFKSAWGQNAADAQF